MSASPCLVTIHGIGFQQPPVDGKPGYADELHEHLRTKLGKRLGDDPERPNERGPVYVSSEWIGSRDKGLGRLVADRPLAPPGKIAHVALVYSPSEPLKPRLGSVADTLIRAILAHSQYIGALGGIRLVLKDGWAALHERDGNAQGDGAARSTLLPRNDQEPPHHHRRLADMLGRHAGEVAEPGLLGIFRALEDDMATYVARNDLRERVRGFVQDVFLALVKLTGEEKMSSLVLNTHSQGTMISWDVLCRMPFESWCDPGEPGRSALSAYVTAGSPIRKYVDLFAWGAQVGQMRPALEAGLSWNNFWDCNDPVADPLNPAKAWKPGEPPEEDPPRDQGLLKSRDPDGRDERHVKIVDRLVDNVANSSGGGLQAHDYWNNVEEFVGPLAAILTDAEAAGARA